MPGVSKAEIERAREIDLLTYLQTYEPDAIKQTSANEYCLVEHDSLKISNGKWNWFSHGIGGKDALTFLVKVRDIDFVEAVRTLNEGLAAPVSYSQPINKPEVKQKPKDGLTLPDPYHNNFRVIAYLQNRGIDRGILDRCIADKTLYEAKNYHNCVFVGRDKDNKPRFACTRSILNNFRQDIAGSDKRYCFNIPSPDPEARYVMLAEAPIDALSLATMRKMYAGIKDNYHYLSLGGTSPLALVQYLTDHPKIDRVIVCLDNDAAGRKCVAKVKETLITDEKLKTRRVSVIKEPPPAGKDFNDTLLAIIQKQKDERTNGRPKEAVNSI